MMNKSRHIVFFISILLVFCLCIPMAGRAMVGRAARETVSMTEFYNDGVFGSCYEKAYDGAVVTISTVEEMKIFLECLYDSKWTWGISFRQEADISFSDYAFAYDSESRHVLLYQNGIPVEYYGNSFSMNDIRRMGLEDICIEVKQGRDFYGQYDGRNHSISGFIVSGGDSRHNGLFGHVGEQASISRLKIKNCFISNACGSFCGFNEGLITDCSAEYILGTGGNFGGVAESNGGRMMRCRLDHGLLYGDWVWKCGGIVGSSYGGSMSDCVAEHLQIQAILMI